MNRLEIVFNRLKDQRVQASSHTSTGGLIRGTGMSHAEAVGVMFRNEATKPHDCPNRKDYGNDEAFGAEVMRKYGINPPAI